MLKRALILCTAVLIPSLANAGVRDDWQVVADTMRDIGFETSADELEAAVDASSDEDLEAVYGEIDLLELADELRSVQAATDSVLDMGYTIDHLDFEYYVGRWDRADRSQRSATGYWDDSDADYPSTGVCVESPNRSNGNDFMTALYVVESARLADEIAKAAWRVAGRGCNQVAVAAGFGGNASTACIAADVAYAVFEVALSAADFAFKALEACDGLVDSAEIEAAFERAGHIHDDLDDVSAQLATHDSDITDQLATHDTDISDQVATHDVNMSTQLAQHDVDISTQLQDHHDEVIAALALHDAEVKALLANLQAGVDENQRLLQVTMARQLELMRLIITPSGQREIDTDVFTCTGPDCPTSFVCADGSYDWPCE